MRRVVLDPSAFLDWFEPPGRALRDEFEAGQLQPYVPTVFSLHVLHAAARRHGLDASRLARLADELGRLRFERRDPPSPELAAWLTRGLDADEAPYAALAASLDVPLVTTDADLLRRASTVAQRP
jgi:predicted nucleic acid-binding protein